MRRSHSIGSPLALVAAVALIVAALGGASAAAKPGSAGASTPGLTLPTVLDKFAEYQSVPLLGAGAPAYAGPATPHSLTKVAMAKTLQRELKLVPALAAQLKKQGFAVVPSGSSLFQAEYEGNIYGGFPVYVTADAAYNAWHLAFDKILRDLEQKVLLPKLDQLVTDLVKFAHSQTVALSHTKLAGDASRAEQIYEVAAAELGLPVKLGPLAVKEKALVDKHDATETSPILGVKIDYSLLTPRGHYTLTKDLTKFFKAMSVLGQLNFCLPGTIGCQTVEPARIGLLASTAFSSSVGDPAIQSLWHAIYDPTSFLVGLADDYTPFELMDAADKAVPSWGGRPGVFATDANVLKTLHALVGTRPVRIDPQRASIRIMGTRFTTDEFLLDQLVYPRVGTAANKRLVPSGLDVAAAFGSTVAKAALDKNGGSKFAHYESQLAAVQKAVATRPDSDWGGTVYDAWLAALQPMFVPHGKAFPDYMRSAAWASKDVQSGLGSYTELKHDTILFAKQLVAEAGGDFSNANPQNWVEPDPVAFKRLASVADLLQQGLEQRKLLTGEAGGLLSTEIDLFRFLGRIASDELARRPLAAADNKRLRTIGDALSAIWWRTSERSHPDPSIPDQAALVADIASSSRGVLELATGKIETIYVIVPSGNGGFELARGGVYSYYEFLNPPGQRLTDESWRARLEQKPPPTRPSWESVFRVPCPHGGQACSPSYVPG